MSDKKHELMKSSADMVEEEMLGAIIDRVKPLLTPALDELEKYLGDDEKMIIIRRPKGSDGYVVIIDTKDIVKFTLSKSNYTRHKMREFLEKLISGKLSEQFGDKTTEE